MSNEIPHLMSFRLAKANPPQLPSHLSNFVQFNPSLNLLQIRGDISGAPTPQILDALIDQGTELRSPLWSFSLQGDFERACAFEIVLSLSGDKRDVRLLNNADDLQDDSVARLQAKLRPHRDARLSKKPQGPFSLIGNNLLVSDPAMEVLGLSSSGSVFVNGKRAGWNVVQPNVCSVLDPCLSFSPSDDRPYRSHLASIAKPEARLTFGLATDTERWGEKLSCDIYLIDMESAATIFPGSKRVFGDVALTPVFACDTPEAELMRSVTKRANRLSEKSH